MARPSQRREIHTHCTNCNKNRHHTTSIQINVNNRCTPESFEFFKLIKLLLTMGKVMLFPYNWNRIVCAGLVRSVTTGSRIPQSRVPNNAPSNVYTENSITVTGNMLVAKFELSGHLLCKAVIQILWILKTRLL